MKRLRALAGAPPLRVAVVVLVFHAAWIGAYFAAGHEIRDFLKLGPYWFFQSDASETITLDPTYDYPQNRDADRAGFGYDGQFYYFIAVDPENAHHYIDDPPYRYSRILYPMLARGTALGDPGAIPYAMLALNWLAIGVGTAAAAAWLRRRGLSPWLGLAFGLFPGALIVLQRDLTEVMGYSLAMTAVYLFDYGGRRGVLLAAGMFALAGLARETTLLFPIILGASIIGGRPNATPVAGTRDRVIQALKFWSVALLPIGAWTIFLWTWLGPAETGLNDLGAPFLGLFTGAWEPYRQPVMLVFLAVPALLCSAVALTQLQRSEGRTESVLLLANVLFIIVLAAEIIWSASYTTMGRASLAILLAALLCLPWVRRRERRAQRAFAAAFALWFALTPVVLVYGFTDFTI